MADQAVTWLLPVKNGMPFLPKALASIEAQSYRNWEIIAWDNGSADASLQELKRWIPSKLPGKIVSGYPLRLSLCLAEMVTLAQTDLIARIDADDVNRPDRLAKQVDYLDRHPEIGAVGGQAQTIDEQGRVRGRYAVLPLEHSGIVGMMLTQNPLIHPTLTMRKSKVVEAGNYVDVGEINIEDYDLWMRMALTTTFSNLPETLIQYRIHNNSSTQIALRNNQLLSASDSRLACHSLKLFGLSSDEALQLRRRENPFALPVFMKIARHLSRIQNSSMLNKLISSHFLISARQLTSSKDYLTRAVLKSLTCLSQKNAIE